MKKANVNQLSFTYLFFNFFNTNCFNFNSYLITCGQDGDIRIWNGIEDGDPIEKCVGSEAFAVHQKVLIF